jgi:hypothetical protein
MLNLKRAEREADSETTECRIVRRDLSMSLFSAAKYLHNSAKNLLLSHMLRMRALGSKCAAWDPADEGMSGSCAGAGI